MFSLLWIRVEFLIREVRFCKPSGTAQLSPTKNERERERELKKERESFKRHCTDTY